MVRAVKIAMRSADIPVREQLLYRGWPGKASLRMGTFELRPNIKETARHRSLREHSRHRK